MYHAGGGVVTLSTDGSFRSLMDNIDGNGTINTNVDVPGQTDTVDPATGTQPQVECYAISAVKDVCMDLAGSAQSPSTPNITVMQQ